MNYKLKTEPEIVYYLETKECIVEDENGVLYEIRVSEHGKGGDFFILEDGMWKEIIDKELMTWILEELPNEKIQ